MSGIMIFAYRTDTLKSDTLNPATTQPDFITQTGKGGDFFLYHIPFGSYRIFAIRDEYRNLVYDREIDEYGIPSSAIRITSQDTLAKGVLMQLAKEDVSGPRLIKVSAKDQHHAVAEFSEGLLPASLVLTSLQIKDTLTGKPLDLVDVFPSPISSQEVIMVTKKQDSAHIYLFSAQGISDSSGNQINPLAHSSAFEGSSKKDTLGFRLQSISLKDSTLNVDLHPVITFVFSDALAKTTSLDFMSLKDKFNKNIPVERKWISSVAVSIEPRQDCLDKTWYEVTADIPQLQDWSGRLCKDTVKVIRFATLDVEDMSSIDGMIFDADKTDVEGNLCLTATLLEGRNSQSYLAIADASGKFNFRLVPEGKYVFQAFRDRNKNKIYDAGKPFPFVFSERLGILSDTVKVRARWPLEGVNVFMQK